MKRSESIKAISQALAKTQAGIGTVAFDSVNPHFRNKYASLTAIIEASREPLSVNGLAILHSVESEADGLRLVSLMTHESGEWIETATPLILTKNDMQGLGSAITYAKRYATAAMLGITADEDDDAEAAVKDSRSSFGARSERNESLAQKPKPQGKAGPISEPGREVNQTASRPAPLAIKPKSEPASELVKRIAEKKPVSPDTHVTSGPHAGKKFDELNQTERENWIKSAEAWFNQKGVDPYVDESDIAKTFRGLKAFQKEATA